MFVVSLATDTRFINNSTIFSDLDSSNVQSATSVLIGIFSGELLLNIISHVSHCGESQQLTEVPDNG